jgi:hypothetical protein
MCYRFELFEFEDGLFKNVDATYILHLEGNGRLEKINEQLKTNQPSNKVYLVYNKGYKKCEKKLEKQSVGHDVIHANLTLFEHAQQYKHILVLEDDFLFSKEVKNHAKHVDTFLKRDTPFIYQLGSIPIIAFPIDMHHYRNYGLLAHANIYSSAARKYIMNDKIIDKNLKGFDGYLLDVLPIYMYYKPLCYQTFPKTDSRKDWFKFDNWKYVGLVLQFIDDTFITLTNLENEPEPGFSIMYFLAKSPSELPQ